MRLLTGLALRPVLYCVPLVLSCLLTDSVISTWYITQPMIVAFVEHYLDTADYELVLWRQTSGGRLIKKLTNKELVRLYLNSPNTTSNISLDSWSLMDFCT